VLIDDLDVDDGRSVLEAHLFGEHAVDRLVGAERGGGVARCGL
jgi:hypothetical protein